MAWWRIVRFWLAGGKRRWFARRAKRLPAAIDRTATVALAGQVLDPVSVGLDIDDERALTLVVACDPRLGETVAASRARPRGVTVLLAALAAK